MKISYLGGGAGDDIDYYWKEWGLERARKEKLRNESNRFKIKDVVRATQEELGSFPREYSGNRGRDQRPDGNKNLMTSNNRGRSLNKSTNKSINRSYLKEEKLKIEKTYTSSQ